MSSTVSLRQVIDSDLPIFFQHQADPVAFEMAAFPSRSLEAFMGHWSRIRIDPQVQLRTIIYDRLVAGTIMSFLLEEKRQVGYWIGRELWGRGIASRALGLFLQEITARPLYAHVAQHNLASLRVLEKHGFKLAGEAPALLTTQSLPDLVLQLDAPR